MSHYAGPSFARVRSGTEVELFVTGRDSENVSRVGIVTGRINKNGFEITNIMKDPVLDVGPLGTFDESGVSYPWLVNTAEETLMFYVGWVAGGKTRFQNFTGLARSRDGYSFKRISDVPLLDRTQEEPFGSGSCCVFLADGKFRMIYTSFESWIPDRRGAKPAYKLREAVSDDCLAWTRTGRVILDFSVDSEHIIGKPGYLLNDQGHHLWYSYRGSAYRIGYASSSNGLDYLRQDERVGIDVSETGWDSEMIEYAHVFEAEQNRYMIYNGNSFGKTGLGLAIAGERL